MAKEKAGNAKGKGKDAGKKGKGKDSGKKGRKGDSALVTHPRAALQIRKAKGWGGLSGFLLVFVLSLQAGAPVFDAMWRAILGGIVGLLVGWTVAVVAWRHFTSAELRMAEKAALAAAEARQAQAGAEAEAGR
ncbi:MAG: hypothetical protein U0R70_13070 [Solirubrobacteraceae bacterium]